MQRRRRTRWNAALDAVRERVEELRIYTPGLAYEIERILDELTEWQDEDRTHTTTERYLDVRLDCRTARLTAA